MLKVLYFSYGSNIDHGRLENRVCFFKQTLKRGIPYILKNYELVFNAGIGFANIIYSKGSTVEGLLYNLTSEQFSRLDKYEVLYNKQFFQIDENTIGCVYIAESDYKKDNSFDKPSLEYLNIIIDGCKKAGLIDTYNKLTKYKSANFKLKRNRHKTVLETKSTGEYFSGLNMYM